MEEEAKLEFTHFDLKKGISQRKGRNGLREKGERKWGEREKQLRPDTVPHYLKKRRETLNYRGGMWEREEEKRGEKSRILAFLCFSGVTAKREEKKGKGGRGNSAGLGEESHLKSPGEGRRKRGRGKGNKRTVHVVVRRGSICATKCTQANEGEKKKGRKKKRKEKGKTR